MNRSRVGEVIHKPIARCNRCQGPLAWTGYATLARCEDCGRFHILGQDGSAGTLTDKELALVQELDRAVSSDKVLTSVLAPLR